MKRKTRDDQPVAVITTSSNTSASGAHTATYVTPGPLPYYGQQFLHPALPYPAQPTWPSTYPVIRLGHILGDPEVVAHCPFCGSGDIVAGADQTISCSFCNRSFLVMEQPQYNSMPGQPGATTDATMPGGQTPPVPGEGAPGTEEADPSATEPPGSVADTPSAPPAAPVNPQTDPESLKKAPPFSFKSSRQDGSIFRTASGYQLDEDDFVKHVAFRVDRDFLVGR